MSELPGSGHRTATLDVAPLLQPGERVLWEGGPDPGVVFARQDAFLVPFSVLLAAFATVWESSAVAARTPLSALIGAPLAAFGLYLVAGRFLYKWRDRRHTRYAVTDRRALVIRLGGRQVRQAPVGGPMAVLRRRDGRHGSVVWALLGLAPLPGSATFGGGSATLLQGTGWPVLGGAGVGHVAFLDVDRFDELLAVVLRARQAAGVTGSSSTPALPGHQSVQGQPFGPSPGGNLPLGGPTPLPAHPPPSPSRPTTPPAGWYPDPDPASSDGERWWDGVGWTFHVRPGPPPGTTGPRPGPVGGPRPDGEPGSP